MSKHLLIGIDPDVDKSGVAALISGTKEFVCLECLSFFDLMDYFSAYKSIYDNQITVYIESGWLNKSNWHTRRNSSISEAAQIGLRTGANHEVGRKIVEMCEYLGIKYVLVKPISSKVNAKTFASITGYKKQTNPEKRDAGILIFGR